MVNQWKIATTTTFGLIGLIIAIPNSGFAASGDWVERYKINGDFRYRYE